MTRHTASIRRRPQRRRGPATKAVRLRGRVAWLAWVALHLVTLVGHRNRLATLANLSVRSLAWPGRLNVSGG